MVQMAGRWRLLEDLQDIPDKEGRELLHRLGQSWPSMPFFSSAKKLVLPRFISKISWERPPDFIIFFPGSFNPWHEGHHYCVKRCLKTLPDAHLVVVPDHNPWKKTVLRGGLWQVYLNLCKELYDLPCSVYPGPWGTGKINYTADWLPRAQVKKRGLLMGGDTFLDILQWKKADLLLLSLHTIMVIGREEDFVEILHMKGLLENKYRHLSVLPFENNPCSALSSSKLRDC